MWCDDFNQKLNWKERKKNKFFIHSFNVCVCLCVAIMIWWFIITQFHFQNKNKKFGFPKPNCGYCCCCCCFISYGLDSVFSRFICFKNFVSYFLCLYFFPHCFFFPAKKNYTLENDVCTLLLSTVAVMFFFLALAFFSFFHFLHSLMIRAI